MKYSQLMAEKNYIGFFFRLASPLPLVWALSVHVCTPDAAFLNLFIFFYTI